uniref:Uncharacterized protein n=1 Tax=Hyaloperonospora arabidopsidis (strain Emoy2) TaxID=559515 RepID=M4BW52_HYAAE
MILASTLSLSLRHQIQKSFHSDFAIRNSQEKCRGEAVTNGDAVNIRDSAAGGLAAGDPRFHQLEVARERRHHFQTTAVQLIGNSTGVLGTTQGDSVSISQAVPSAAFVNALKT